MGKGCECVLVGVLVGVLVLMLVLMLVELGAQVGRRAQRGPAVSTLGGQETGVKLLTQQVLFCFHQREETDDNTCRRTSCVSAFFLKDSHLGDLHIMYFKGKVIQRTGRTTILNMS